MAYDKDFIEVTAPAGTVAFWPYPAGQSCATGLTSFNQQSYDQQRAATFLSLPAPEPGNEWYVKGCAVASGSSYPLDQTVASVSLSPRADIMNLSVDPFTKPDGSKWFRLLEGAAENSQRWYRGAGLPGVFNVTALRNAEFPWGLPLVVQAIVTANNPVYADAYQNNPNHTEQLISFSYPAQLS